MTSKKQGPKTPFEDLMPAQSAEEKQALKQRIKDEGGIHDPILLTEDHEVLDGHNRLAIKKDPRAVVLHGSGKWSEAQKKAFVVRCNLGRRNLSHEQRREVLATSVIWGDRRGRHVHLEG